MLLLGVCPDNGDGFHAIARISKTLRRVRKHYRVDDVVRLDPGSAMGDLAAEIARRYRDPGHIVSKRIFSQDRRPAKTVQVHPTVVIAVAGRDRRLIESLRRQDVAVEAVALEPVPGFRKVSPGKALGNDFFVGRLQVAKAVGSAYAQGRLTVAEGLPFADRILRELARYRTGDRDGTLGGGGNRPAGAAADILTATSLPVWFSETIRYRRAYRAH